MSELGIDSRAGTRFETISYKSLRTILSCAQKEGISKFLDIGCGLGRSLIVSDEVGFNDIYGVDISQALIEFCKKNLSKKDISAQLSCCDLDDLDIPQGRLAVYLFNSFGEDRMTRLVEKFLCRDSDTLIIYHNPKHGGCFNKDYHLKDIVWNHFGLYQEKASLYLIPARVRHEESL